MFTFIKVEGTLKLESLYLSRAVTQLFVLLLSTLYLYTLSYFTDSRVAAQHTAVCYYFLSFI